MFCAFINVKYNIWAREQQGQWRYSQISVPVINLGLIMVWNNKGSLSGLINVRSFIRVGSKARFCELEKEMIVEKRIWENQGFIGNRTLTLKTTGRKVFSNWAESRQLDGQWYVVCQGAIFSKGKRAAVHTQATKKLCRRPLRDIGSRA